MVEFDYGNCGRGAKNCGRAAHKKAWIGVRHYSDSPTSLVAILALAPGNFKSGK